jgi:hypothetical protein
MEQRLQEPAFGISRGSFGENAVRYRLAVDPVVVEDSVTPTPAECRVDV